jgi:inorganic pyrophosphatase
MEIKVTIEIPEGSSVKYEIDETTGQLTIDRIMPTAMRFPFSYGLIHDTHGQDGDPLDVLVFFSQPVYPGVTVKCRVLGLLEMEDEAGIDHKVIAVPLEKIDFITGAWQSLDDVPTHRKDQIRHFFEHYKDLEKNKWVKLKQWRGVGEAQKIIEAAYSAAKSK